MIPNHDERLAVKFSLYFSIYSVRLFIVFFRSGPWNGPSKSRLQRRGGLQNSTKGHERNR